MEQNKTIAEILEKMAQDRNIKLEKDTVLQDYC
jgi:hypothetical protein